jgi:two-component system cell cycle sensor histidine kinase/response regulator CckA
MTQNFERKEHTILNLWLPIFIGFAGILISIVVWFALSYDLAPEGAVRSFHNSLPWIALSITISLTLLTAIVLYLSRISYHRQKTYQVINENLKREIAERMIAEETKQRLEKNMLQGQKLQAIGTLAGGIAHDFNNLLYAIIGYVGMARDDADKNSLIYKNLGKVLEACQRGQELISRILSFSRRQHHELIPLNIKETIEGVLSLLRPTIPATVNINILNVPDDCWISGNQTQLHQVIVNIINNAVDAMDGEGDIDIRVTKVTPHEKNEHKFLKTIASNCCKIEISDSGQGMDESTMGRIFEPFFTTKEVGKGTGLGLATVHTIVTEHQGEILVTSRLGKGTTFTILLPELSKESVHGKNSVS